MQQCSSRGASQWSKWTSGERACVVRAGASAQEIKNSFIFYNLFYRLYKNKQRKVRPATRSYGHIESYRLLYRAIRVLAALRRTRARQGLSFLKQRSGRKGSSALDLAKRQKKVLDLALVYFPEEQAKSALGIIDAVSHKDVRARASHAIVVNVVRA